ncbi:hypothetical protein Adt_20767 [Abeliophyllum distichum]|uniref:Uncharacterized protein n=1 Tax=Abeliophyllum distichum TaxID=126358 RepID=A0ABD1SXH0_9LAMI
MEDVLEAGLATVVRVTCLQLKVLGKFRTRMQEPKQLVAEASKSYKEHQQALEEGPTDALEAANKEKRRLQAKSESHEWEAQCLRRDLEASKRGKKEAEAKVAQLVGEKKEMEAMLECVEAEFEANFHNTDAYTNFSDYFSRVGHQEVLAVLRTDHPSLNLGSLQAMFSPPDVEDREDS